MITKSDRPETLPDADANAATGAGFDGLALARRLLRQTRAGALATLDRDGGGPVCTLVTVATAPDGSPLLLLSDLAAHAGNLDADGRASLLLAATGKGDPLAHPRLTLRGTVARTTNPENRRRFLARHPKAALYVDFPDFSTRAFTIAAASLNGGFARAARFEGSALATDLSGADALLAAEEGALAHLNADHADALALYATRLCGAPPGPWRATGLDPDGLDLLAGDATCRLSFAPRVTDPSDLRRILVELAAAARALP